MLGGLGLRSVVLEMGGRGRRGHRHRDYFQVLWAMSWHVQPERDLYVNRATAGVALDPSVAEEDVNQLERKTVLSSKVGVDATRKHAFPARSVPPGRSRPGWTRSGPTTAWK